MLTQDLNWFEGRNILLLGAGGFIGRHVSKALNDVGACTLRVLKPKSGASPDPTDDTSLRRCDLADLRSLRTLLEERPFDIVFNLASYGVNPAQQDEPLAQQLNTALPELLAQVLDETPATRLVHVGSAAEYGAATGDLREGTPEKPMTVYGRTKLEGTRSVLGNCANAVVARLFTVYGEGEREGRLLPSLFSAAVQGKDIDLTSGRQVRDFTHVADVAAGLLRLGCSASPAALVNVATGRLHSVREFCLEAALATGMESDHLHFGARVDRDDEMEHEPVNVDHLFKSTGWKPETDLRDGVRRAWRVFLRSNKS